ncbi:hypothetical protein HAX54_031692 [Datura stramonium]|uniref:Uncharacterized protein n=1 Tax=Datura stramonium TaxID=4076 RepID=A0ABS8VCC7_DATST|nr:hypothetical protein [Datura stramonium]
MAPKPSKVKGVAYSSNGSKSLRKANEEANEDVSLPQQPLRHFGLHILNTLGLDIMFNDPGECNLNMPLSENSRALCKVGLEFEKPLDNDDATNLEMARVDSDLESDDEDDSEMGETALAPTNDED